MRDARSSSPGWPRGAARLAPRAARCGRGRRTCALTPRGSTTRSCASAPARGGGLPGRRAGRRWRCRRARSFAVALHACLLRRRAGRADRPAARRRGARRALSRTLRRRARRAARRRRARDVAAAARPRRRRAIVVHTSGTTGAPKPVELTYGNWLWSALGARVALGSTRDERWLCTLPLSHVGGLSILLRSAIYGTTAIVHERFDADRALAALQRADATLVSLVPTTLARLLDAGLRAPPRAALRR